MSDVFCASEDVKKNNCQFSIVVYSLFLAGPSQDSAFVPGSFENDLFSEQGLALSKTV
jgi:hypothetical protein